MKPTKSFTLFLLLTLAVFVTTSCRQATKFSVVLEGDYDPVAIFRQAGYAVRISPAAEGIRNAEYGYGWQSWCGILAGAEKQPDCAAVAGLIRDGLNRTLGSGSLDELTTGATGNNPLTGMLLYNKDEVHGDMHVWLLPDATNATVSFVIFVREERRK